MNTFVLSSHPGWLQTWADTFISELNDTHVEAELRTRNIPPQLDFGAAVSCYRAARKRLLVLGYNATLTTAVEAPRQPKKHLDQIQALTRVNPAAYSCLAALAQSPDTQVRMGEARGGAGIYQHLGGVARGFGGCGDRLLAKSPWGKTLLW